MVIVIGYRRISLARKETAQKNERLEQLDRINKEVFGIISHDLRDPLMSLGILADSLGHSELSLQQLQKFAADLKNHVGQTSQVLESLLNWARAELGVDFSSAQSADASAISKEIMAGLSAASKAKELEFVNEIEDGATVNMHSDILRIVLRNLLTNAVKYSHEGEEIFVRITPNGAISVRDTGVGIAPEKLALLGKETVMSDMGTANETGFGLGLYISFELVRKSGWNMTVDSTVGRGTQFEFGPTAT
ncbi:MAG: HAMP domain-containing sensor histidine kinase [Pseudomonadota bacterium]